jgi:hypothetical protein
VATRVFADDELERLRGFPEISKEELIRFFTLTPGDVGFIDPGRGRSPKDRLGLVVQLCALPWLGFVPDDVGPCGASESSFPDPVGVRVGVEARERPRRDHVSGPFSLFSGGGWGRGRTGDLPLFRRTLVPTELPSRSGPDGI